VNIGIPKEKSEGRKLSGAPAVKTENRGSFTNVKRPRDVSGEQLAVNAGAGYRGEYAKIKQQVGKKRGTTSAFEVEDLEKK